MTADRFYIALFALFMALWLASELTEGPPLMGGIDVIETRLGSATD